MGGPSTKVCSVSSRRVLRKKVGQPPQLLKHKCMPNRWIVVRLHPLTNFSQVAVVVDEQWCQHSQHLAFFVSLNMLHKCFSSFLLLLKNKKKTFPCIPATTHHRWWRHKRLANNDNFANDIVLHACGWSCSLPRRTFDRNCDGDVPWQAQVHHKSWCGHVQQAVPARL